MNLKKRHRYQMRTYAIMAAIGCLVCFQSARAGTFFPFSVEDGSKGDIAASLMGEETVKGVVEKSTKNKGSAGRTSECQTMENLNMYGETSGSSPAKFIFSRYFRQFSGPSSS